MKVTDPKSPHRIDNLSVEKREAFQQRSRLACKDAKFSEKMSQVATLRHFRDKNTDISILMDYYKEGDQLKAISKYMTDNEQFISLFNDAKDNKEKSDILSKYMGFQLKMHELMFGTKADVRNINVNVDAGSAKNMNEIWKEVKKNGTDKK